MKSIKKLVLGATAAALCSISLSASPVLIKSWDWTASDGALHEYEAYCYPDQSWSQASSKVNVADGWHLLTITSAAEQDALSVAMKNIEGEFWMGAIQTPATETNPNGSWTWITGEAWTYSNWAPGEPNDYYGSKTEQYAAVWSKWNDCGSTWKWNDEGHLPNIKGYVVERSHSLPEPSTFSLLLMGVISLAGYSTVRRKK